MKYFYGEFDGTEFPTPDKLFGFDQLMQFIMQYGEQALRAIQEMLNDPKNPEQSDMLEKLLEEGMLEDRKSTRLNSSHGYISYAVFCLKKKNKNQKQHDDSA